MNAGFIYIVCTLRFHTFRPPSPCVDAHMLLAYTLFPLVWAYRYFLKKIFQRLSIKKTHTTLQNKETTVQSYQKILNQNTKKSPGIKGTLFNCTGEMGMDNFGCLNSSLSLLLFCSKTAKKIYGIHTLTADCNHPPPPPSAPHSTLHSPPSTPHSTLRFPLHYEPVLLAGPPLPST